MSDITKGQGLAILVRALQRPPPPRSGWMGPAGTTCCVLHITSQHLNFYQNKLSTPHPHLIFTLSLTFIFIVIPPVVFLFIKWGEGYIIFCGGQGLAP